MFHDIIEVGPEGTLMEGDGAIARASTRPVVGDKLINHVNVHAMPSARESAPLVQRAPGACRHHAALHPGHRQHRSAAQLCRQRRCRVRRWRDVAGGRSRSASAALRNPERIREFADIARQEYLAVGIRSALHPQIDLTTEPRWGRQFHSFGNDADFVAEVAAAYIDGFQRRPELGPDSVATMAKHFPGGGPQADGEDPHFPYGREQVYPGGQFEYHLKPFRSGDRGRHLSADALLRHAGGPGA